jgi:hypothetical protein
VEGDLFSKYAVWQIQEDQILLAFFKIKNLYAHC